MNKKVFKYLLLLGGFLLFPLSAFSNSWEFTPDSKSDSNTKPQTCSWTDYHSKNPVSVQITTQCTVGGILGKVTCETCAQARARKQGQADRARASRNAGKGITGGSILSCTWTSPELPDLPSQTFTLSLKVKSYDEEGNPQYETCQSAQRRKQSQWMKTNFPGIDRRDVEQAVADQERKRQEQFEEEQLSASERAQKAAQKQEKTSMITAAGSMAAAVAGMACSAQCSPTPSGCCPKAPYLFALSAGLGLMSMLNSDAAGDNRGISGQYTPGGGLIPSDGGNPYGSDGNTDDGPGDIPEYTKDPDSDETDSGAASADNGATSADNGATSSDNGATSSDGNIGVVDGSTGETTSIGGGGDLDTVGPNWQDNAPKIRLPNGDVVRASPKHIGPYLKKKGLKWDPKKGRITLPNGQSYSADDGDKFKSHASSPQVMALKGQMPGLAKQINQALGDEGEEGLADGSGGIGGSGQAGMGGGGFNSYGKGRGGSSGGRSLLASAGAGGSSAGGTGADGNDSSLAGMSVKHGKNRVGVSQDNIFAIVHRRYQAKRKKQHFIELGR